MSKKFFLVLLSFIYILSSFSLVHAWMMQPAMEKDFSGCHGTTSEDQKDSSSKDCYQLCLEKISQISHGGFLLDFDALPLFCCANFSYVFPPHTNQELFVFLTRGPPDQIATPYKDYVGSTLLLL